MTCEFIILVRKETEKETVCDEEGNCLFLHNLFSFLAFFYQYGQNMQDFPVLVLFDTFSYYFFYYCLQCKLMYLSKLLRKYKRHILDL